MKQPDQREAEAAAADPSLFAHQPEVIYRGFRASGYEIAHDHPLVTTLSRAIPARLAYFRPSSTRPTSDGRVSTILTSNCLAMR